MQNPKSILITFQVLKNLHHTRGVNDKNSHFINKIYIVIIINVTPGTKPARDLQSASTVVIGAGLSNTNLNNNNNNNDTTNSTTEGNNRSSSKIDFGHQMLPSTMSTDSVFVGGEIAQETKTEDGTIKSQGSESILKPPDTANQDQEKTEVEQEQTTEQQQQEEDVEGKISEQKEREEIGDESLAQELDKGDGGDTSKGDATRPQSSASRNSIDECNSVTQLPKVIVRKSITAAVNRLSLHKDSEDEAEVSRQEDQTNKPVEGEHGERVSEAHQEEVIPQEQYAEQESYSDTVSSAKTEEVTTETTDKTSSSGVEPYWDAAAKNEQATAGNDSIHVEDMIGEESLVDAPELTVETEDSNKSEGGVDATHEHGEEEEHAGNVEGQSNPLHGEDDQ